MKKKIAIVPGSFDPITYGHIDIITRSAQLFDEVIVAILVNPDKKYLFTLEERENMIHETIKGLDNVRVDSFSGLLVNYAKKVGSSVIVRGLNKALDEDIETFYMMANKQYSFISSSIVKGVSGFGADLSKFVPKNVEEKLEKKMKERK